MHIEYTAQHSAALSGSISVTGVSFNTKFPVNITKNTPVMTIKNPMIRFLLSCLTFVKKRANIAVSTGAVARIRLTLETYNIFQLIES